MIKTQLKKLFQKKLFHKLFSRIPFIYDKEKFISFQQAMQSFSYYSALSQDEYITKFERSFKVLNGGKEQEKKLLEFISVTLVNEPEVWSFYNKSLFKFDRNGRIMVKYQHGCFFNPSTLCQYALSLFDAFGRSNQPHYRTLFLSQVRLLLQEAEDENGELQFPYRFDFFDMVKGPWLSGLAQGLAIAVFIRAYVLTGNAEYLYYAIKAKQAINTKNRIEINNNGLLWIEEYPTVIPSLVLNGFVTTVICLFEFKMFFPFDKELSDKLDAYLNTIKSRIDIYDLGHGSIRYSMMKENTVNNNYLGFQCLQMFHLYYYTGDPFFHSKFLKWKSYFDGKEFISSYLPFNKLNRRLKDIAKQ
jgi:hypothetical protein